MIDIKNRDYCPTLDEIGEYIGNLVFNKFCMEIKTKYNSKAKIEFSSCSYEKGWNIKYKKSGKTLCTIYPRESYFTIMIVVGRKEKEMVESILPSCTIELQDIYCQTKEGNGQRWLMIDLEDSENMYHDIFRLIEIRSI